MKKSKLFDFSICSEIGKDTLWAELIMFCKHLIDSNKPIEVSEVIRKRTNSQNNSIHLYCSMIARQLNDIGLTYVFTNPIGWDVELVWNTEIVKEYIWRPVQKEMFQIESTKDLKMSGEIEQIIQVLDKAFAERGIDVEFPSM